MSWKPVMYDMLRISKNIQFDKISEAFALLQLASEGFFYDVLIKSL